ncbi:MAG: HDOD domain-containing protein [Gemmatimonadetes bacterium]|nr:HDOD domain-containing protein [Gemmatimonadota bacterium]MBT5056427.1 HDOD domain-containing protein [Gemmatimonadota bacterium]MBT5145996.1 HDOD domain-containing protein [Gemmatimonadota bacterium]MBT5591925.1 HDOD domain-containing protein [Gemmatimonadota bacterium]MBT5961600.1 HDOD domain-containing protein [Gemmatimonadota bacterium]
MPATRKDEGIRILIAERDPQQGAAMASLLGQGSSLTVEHVTTMKEAVKRLKMTHFSLVITNTAVDKEKDGIRLVQMILLRRMVAAPPPVMIVSPLRDGAVIRNGMRLGVIDYIVYPYDPEDLKSRVQRVLGDWGDMPEAEMDAAIQQTLTEIIDLPTISPVCNRLENMLASADVTADAVADVIQLDPSIAARILKLANSAEFGLQRRIASVKEAVTMIGMKKVAAIVQAVGTFDAMGRVPQSPHFDRLLFWKHSIGTGAIAGVLAKGCGLDANQALVAGVLHDVGKVIMDSFFPDLFREALEKADAEHIPFLSAETELLPITHETVGRYLVGSWGLPARLVDVVGAHHSLAPERDDHVRLVQLVHVADAACRRLGVGRAGDDDTSLPNPGALAGIGLTADSLDDLRPDFEKAVQKEQALLELL